MSIIISAGYVERDSVMRIKNYSTNISEASWGDLGRRAKELNLDCLQYACFPEMIFFNYRQCRKIMDVELAILMMGDSLTKDMWVIEDLRSVIKQFLDEGPHTFLIIEHKNRGEKHGNLV